jgi:hypothetical protein
LYTLIKKKQKQRKLEGDLAFGGLWSSQIFNSLNLSLGFHLAKVSAATIVLNPITRTFLENKDLFLPQSHRGNKRSALKSPAGSQGCFF